MSVKEGRGVQQILSVTSKSQLWNISNLQVILPAHRNRSLPSLGIIVYQSAVDTNTGAHKENTDADTIRETQRQTAATC